MQINGKQFITNIQQPVTIMKRLLFFIAVCLLTGCTGTRFMETDLYFGMSLPDGRHIDTTAWNRFVQEEISAVFPDGFTVIPANGSWKNKQGTIITEPSHVVVTLHKKSPALDRRIDSLKKKYQSAFQQESVLQVDLPVKKVSF